MTVACQDAIGAVESLHVAFTQATLAYRNGLAGRAGVRQPNGKPRRTKHYKRLL